MYADINMLIGDKPERKIEEMPTVKTVWVFFPVLCSFQVVLLKCKLHDNQNKIPCNSCNLHVPGYVE